MCVAQLMAALAELIGEVLAQFPKPEDKVKIFELLRRELNPRVAGLNVKATVLVGDPPTSPPRTH